MTNKILNNIEKICSHCFSARDNIPSIFLMDNIKYGQYFLFADGQTAFLWIEMKTADKEVQVNTFYPNALSKRSLMYLIRNDNDLVALTGISSMDKLL